MCLVKFATMFVLQNDKAATDLNANFGLFTVDGDKMLYHGSSHNHYIRHRARHSKVVSINF